MKSSRKKKFMILVILSLIAFFYRMWDIDRPQETVDEFEYYSAGVAYYYNILHLDFNSSNWFQAMEHPPIAKYIYGFVDGLYLLTRTENLTSFKLGYEEGKQFLLETKNFVPSRVVSALMGVLTCIVVFLIAMEFFDLRTAIFSFLILSFLPYFIGYTKLATMEAPSIFFYTLAVYFFLKAIKIDNNNKYYLLSAIATSLAIGVRYTNLSLLILLPIIYLFYKRRELISKGKIEAPLYLIIFPIIVFLLFFVSWPWLWGNPFKNLLISLQRSTFLPEEYFLGKFGDPPFYYYLVYFIATTPIVLLFLFFLSLANGIKSKKFCIHVLILWILVPLLLQSSIKLKQGGVRYVSMIFPPFSILSGIGFVHLTKKIKKKKTLLIFTLFMFYMIWNSVSIHPYYLVYYNEIVGGPENVWKNRWFNIGLWGGSISETIGFLNENVETNSSVQFFMAPAGIMHPPISRFKYAVPMLRNDIRIIPGIESNVAEINATADYVVTNSFYLWRKEIPKDMNNFYDVVHRLKIDNVTLITIYKNKGELYE